MQRCLDPIGIDWSVAAVLKSSLWLLRDILDWQFVRQAHQWLVHQKKSHSSNPTWLEKWTYKRYLANMLSFKIDGFLIISKHDSLLIAEISSNNIFLHFRTFWIFWCVFLPKINWEGHFLVNSRGSCQGLATLKQVPKGFWSGKQTNRSHRGSWMHHEKTTTKKVAG